MDFSRFYSLQLLSFLLVILRTICCHCLRTKTLPVNVFISMHILTWNPLKKCISHVHILWADCLKREAAAVQHYYSGNNRVFGWKTKCCAIEFCWSPGWTDSICEPVGQFESRLKLARIWVTWVSSGPRPLRSISFSWEEWRCNMSSSCLQIWRKFTCKHEMYVFGNFSVKNAQWGYCRWERWPRPLEPEACTLFHLSLGFFLFHLPAIFFGNKSKSEPFSCPIFDLIRSEHIIFITEDWKLNLKDFKFLLSVLFSVFHVFSY